MMPRLAAEEQLTGVRVATLGAGLYSGRDAQALLQDLERRARPPEAPQRARRAAPADLAAMGIGIISEPSQAGVNDG